MKRPLIAVNTRMLLKNRLDGIGWFACQTLRRITRAHPEVDFVFLFDRPYDPDFLFAENVRGVIVAPPIRHGLLYYPWFQIAIKARLRRLAPDLFLSPDGLLSLGARCPQLAVVHDINFAHHPKDLPYWTQKFFNRYFPQYVQAAARIVTVSEFSRQDIVQTYDVDPHKIEVIYNGVNENFGPLSETAQQAIREKYTNGKNYFLFVGSLHPRKNVTRLIQAFAVFKEKSRSDMKLVIVGPNFWGEHSLHAALQKTAYKDDIIFTGRLDDDELARVMATACALTYVPYFEGFGIPLVEAMRSEIPIIAANVTALPEIAGGAALYVNPLAVEEIAQAMNQIYSDKNLRARLIAAGKIRGTEFSWDKTATQLWAAIEKILPVAQK